MPTTAERLTQIEASLARIERALQTRVPAADERAHIAESAVTADQVDTLADAVPLQGQQLDAIVLWMHERMSGDKLRFSFEDLEFVTKQLIGILQGTRADIVQMRATLLRLAGLLEQVPHARVDDNEESREAT